MGYWIGTTIGASIGLAALTVILRWAVFKRVLSNPAHVGVASAATAYTLAVVLYGFGSTNGGPWKPDGAVLYLPAALIVGFLFWRNGDAARTDVI